MKSSPLEAMAIPNVVPFDNTEIENITPIDSQTELWDVTLTQDNVVFTEINEPIETDFTITPTTAALYHPNTAIEKREQMHLLTIHESLGNTSFHIIRLLCLSDILPRELANVAPPLCPRFS